MQSKLTKKKKMMAYVLNKDPDYCFTQGKIAELMDVSQSTICKSIQTIDYERRIADLTQQLDEARNTLIQNNILPETIVFKR